METLESSSSSSPPSNPLIKSPFIRNAFGLNLSGAKLANEGEFSIGRRAILINNDSKLCSFLTRTVNTMKRSGNEEKKSLLLDWATSFKELHRIEDSPLSSKAFTLLNKIIASQGETSLLSSNDRTDLDIESTKEQISRINNEGEGFSKTIEEVQLQILHDIQKRNGNLDLRNIKEQSLNEVNEENKRTLAEGLRLSRIYQ